jgi:peroxiredoxin
MLRNIFFTLAALLPMQLWAQAERPFTVKLNTADEKAQLARYTLKKGKRMDTAAVINGQTVFHGTVDDERQKGQLLTMQHSFLFYLEPGTINITYDQATGRYHVSGTKLNNELEIYNRMFYHLMDTIHADKKSDGNFQFSPLVHQNKIRIIEQFLKQHPNSPVSLDELNEYATYGGKDVAKTTQLYKQLSPALRSSAVGVELATRIKGMDAPKIGAQAPGFSIPDVTGTKVSLSSFKGKYVLVDFWATWCGPCVAEIPNLVKAYNTYKNKNFDIISISLDRPDSKDLWIQKVKEYNMTWPQVSELKWWNGPSALRYHISSVPANFLLDTTGKIIAMTLRGDALQKKLAEIIPGASQSFSINGKINSDTAVTGKVYLNYDDNDTGQRDSAVLVNNTYHFEGTMNDGAIRTNITLEDRTLPDRKGRFKGFTQVYVVPGQTSIEHKSNFVLLKIQGSPVQDDEDSFEALRRKHSIDEKELTVNFIKSHPASWFSYILLEERFIRSADFSAEQADSLCHLLSPQLQQYARVKTFESMLAGRKTAVIGHMAPSFSQKDMNGKVIGLADYKGRYVLLDFWASWCHPCRAENPNVTAAYHKYKDKGLNILSVSLDGTRDAWVEAVKHDKLEWPQVSNLKAFNDEIAVKYGIHSIPRNFLIGPDGKIVAMDLRGDDLDKQLGEIFK